MCVIGLYLARVQFKTLGGLKAVNPQYLGQMHVAIPTVIRVFFACYWIALHHVQRGHAKAPVEWVLAANVCQASQPALGVSANKCRNYLAKLLGIIFLYKVPTAFDGGMRLACGAWDSV